MKRIINGSNSSIRNYLLKVLRNEQKWMYHYNIDDPCFGIETDKYRVVSLVLDNKWDISKLIDYLEDNYGDDERYFIDQLIKLSRY